MSAAIESGDFYRSHHHDPDDAPSLFEQLKASHAAE
jgi:hypothetical protein